MVNLDAPQKLPDIVEPNSQDEQVSRALEKFCFIQNRLLHHAVVYYPLLVAIVLVVDAFAFQGRQIVYDLVRLTGYVAVAVATIFFARLNDLVPETLKTIWDRGVLKSASALADSEDYARFIAEFERALNNRAGWVLAALLVLPYAWLYAGLIEISLGSIMRVGLAVLNWLIAGVAIWRLVVVGYMVSRIPARFDLNIQPSHPDRAGGLQPFGELCLGNALAIITPAIFLGCWIFVFATPAVLISHSDLGYLVGYFQSGVLQVGLIVLVILGLTTFFLPLYRIHREMIRQRIQYQQRLDALTRRMNEIAQEMLDPHLDQDSGAAQKRLDTLKWMRQVYQESNDFPTWPFNRNIVVRLSLSQVIPVLSLVGVRLPAPALDILSNTLNVFQPK